MRPRAFAPLLAATCIAACGSPASPRAPDAALDVPPLVAANKSPKPSRPADPELDLAAFLARPDVQSLTPANAGAFVNVSALRDHAIGPRFAELLRGMTHGLDLVDAIDWIVVVGADVLRIERGIALIRVRPGADVAWHVDRVMRAKASGAPWSEIEIEGARAWRLPDSDRVVVRVRPDLALITHEAEAIAATPIFEKGAPGPPPAQQIVALHATRDAHVLALLPLSTPLEELNVVVDSKSDGGLDLRFSARCADAKTAATAAKELTDAIAQVNAVGVGRLITRNVLDDAKATVAGSSINLALHAEPSQVTGILEALAASP